MDMDKAAFIDAMKRLALNDDVAGLSRLARMNPVLFSQEITRVKALMKRKQSDTLTRDQSKSDKRREKYMQDVMRKRKDRTNH